MSNETPLAQFLRRAELAERRLGVLDALERIRGPLLVNKSGPETPHVAGYFVRQDEEERFIKAMSTTALADALIAEEDKEKEKIK